jgi:hypothetical protein
MAQLRLRVGGSGSPTGGSNDPSGRPDGGRRGGTLRTVHVVLLTLLVLALGRALLVRSSPVGLLPLREGSAGTVASRANLPTSANPDAPVNASADEVTEPPRPPPCPQYGEWFRGGLGDVAEYPLAAAVAVLVRDADAICFFDPPDLATVAMVTSSAKLSSLVYMITPRMPKGPILKFLQQRNRCQGATGVARHVPDPTIVPSLRCDVSFVSRASRWASMRKTGFGNETARYLVFLDQTPIDSRTGEPLFGGLGESDADRDVGQPSIVSQFDALRMALPNDLTTLRPWRRRHWVAWPALPEAPTLLVLSDAGRLLATLRSIAGPLPSPPRRGDDDDEADQAGAFSPPRRADDAGTVTGRKVVTDPPAVVYRPTDVDSQKQFIRLAASRYARYHTAAGLIGQYELDNEVSRQMLHYATHAVEGQHARIAAIEGLFRRATDDRSVAFRSRLAAIQFRSTGHRQDGLNAAVDETSANGVKVGTAGGLSDKDRRYLKSDVYAEGGISEVLAAHRAVANSAYEAWVGSGSAEGLLPAGASSFSVVTAAANCSTVPPVVATGCGAVLEGAAALLADPLFPRSALVRRLRSTGAFPFDQMSCLQLCPAISDRRDPAATQAKNPFADRRDAVTTRELAKSLRLTVPAFGLALRQMLAQPHVAVVGCQPHWVVLAGIAVALARQQVAGHDALAADAGTLFQSLADKQVNGGRGAASSYAASGIGTSSVAVVAAPHCDISGFESGGFPVLPTPTLAAEVPSQTAVLVVTAADSAAFVMMGDGGEEGRPLPFELRQVWVTGSAAVPEPVLGHLLQEGFECLYSGGLADWWVRTVVPPRPTLRSNNGGV